MKKFLLIFAFTVLFLNNAQGENYMGNQTLKGETLKEANFLGSATLTDVKATTLSVLGGLIFHNLTVDNDANVAGSVTKSKNGTFHNLSVLGKFEATDVTCKNLAVAGPVTAKNITCKQLEVAGPVTVTGLTVTGETSIAGPLTLKAPKDPKMSQNKLQNLTVSAEKIALDTTDVQGDIQVKQARGWLGRDKKQVLQLKGKTTVKGNITFESGKGEIEQGPDVKVKGKITGATVKTK